MVRLTYKQGARTLLPSLLSLLILLVGCQSTSLSQVTANLEVDPATAVRTADPTLPVAADEAAPPVTLQIGEIGLSLAVEPMGWVVADVNGQTTTEWIIPTDAVGWHVNSAQAGTAGNLILSGHQIVGEAVFAPLALGDVVVGQDVVITDAAGETFLYRVTEVSEPVPILGATEEDVDLARSFLQPSETPILTMMSGWPDFTTTHRIFAVAEFVERTGS